MAHLDLIKGVTLALAGDWEGAHAVAQAHEGQPQFDYLHGIVHRIEGDDGNARYWYAQAGSKFDAGVDPKAELAALKAQIEGRSKL